MRCVAILRRNGHFGRVARLMLICRSPRVGILLRRFFGALAGTRIHPALLRRLFGAFLLVVALHMIFGRHGR
jgi:uncharacterized membrane protein YfcA